MLEDHMRLLAQFEKQKNKYEAKIEKIENEKNIFGSLFSYVNIILVSSQGCDVGQIVDNFPTLVTQSPLDNIISSKLSQHPE